ncbi:DUF1433 domain-containing protein [Isobaculum melis]|uniref:DUF1433 domain-containing protein n=1 Tax=Isobaculum melis TaxID=142588 RepID=A0A1H9ULG9_9LACT|nr:DUF1433 domain-containing protein [Isobaculum melis]SES10189.1 Protein of unknown function [Isobaculum melis]
MAKKKIIIATGAFILLLLGGYQIMQHKETKVYEQQKIEQKFWDEQKVRIEKFIRYNFKDIESVTFTENYKTPMSVAIKGYINEDKKNLNFIATISNEQDFFEKGFASSPGISRMAINSSHILSVTEIEELEKTKDTEN